MSIAGDLLDSMTSIILEGYVNTASKADHDVARENVRLFLLQHIGKLELWARTHPGRRPPVYFNSDTGEVSWLNRSQDRRLKRAMVKAQRARG